MTRKRSASRMACGSQTLSVPPRPCTRTTASPLPASWTARPSMRFIAIAVSRSDEAVLDDADAVDFDADDVARPQPARRHEAHSNAGRRASRDHVAGMESDAARDRFDQRGDVEDHVLS